MASPGSKRQQRLLVMCASELIGTALLVLIGLSIVIFDLGRGSPLIAVLPSAAARRAFTGGLFGATGMSIALSPVGRVSGAHINPVVSIAFWFERTLPTKVLLQPLLRRQRPVNRVYSRRSSEMMSMASA